MSAIFGFCSFDDLPTSHIEQNIQKMKEALDLWAPDGFKTIITDSAGFGIAVQALRDVDQHHAAPDFISKIRSHPVYRLPHVLITREELIERSLHQKIKPKHDSELILEQYLQNG
ncbi:MAG: hypothetical protein U5K72_02110 [Balneolaceae bacterium]|nr:hypothetical protein [Balneolaceae bacterium]